MDEYARKMEDWKEAYPFAAFMLSDATFEEKVKYAEERFNGN